MPEWDSPKWNAGVTDKQLLAEMDSRDKKHCAETDKRLRGNLLGGVVLRMGPLAATKGEKKPGSACCCSG
jgi:hypothetical protein